MPFNVENLFVFIHLFLTRSFYFSEFNLCEEKTSVINRYTLILLTTPLSSSDDLRRYSCKCEISSKNPDQLSNVTITRRRMPRLFNQDVLTYKYEGTSYRLASQYSPYFLEQQYQNHISTLGTVSIELANSQRLKGISRVFIIILPGEYSVFYL